MKTRPAPPAGRIYGGTAPQERAALRRAQFLAAGIELFGTEGYRATTVRALCREAGLTDRYFYESFADMEALLMAAYSECTAKLDTAIADSVNANVGRDAGILVQGVLDAFFRVVQDDPRIARIVWLEVLGVSPAIDRLYNRQVLQFATQVGSLTRLVVPDAGLPAAEQDVLCIAVVGAVSQSAMYWLLSGYSTPRKTIVAANTRIVLGLVASLAASPKPLPSRRKRS